MTERKERTMNALDFICGQLLSFEMMKQTRHAPPRLPLAIPNRLFPKERIMENQLLIIAFLLVGLVANMTVMTSSEK